MWTMLEGFQQLSGEELDSLIDAPALITILIGAADGKLDREELAWSERLMRARTYSKPHLINDYYRVAADDFLGKIDRAMEDLPDEVEQRSQKISSILAELNPVLAKLDHELAATLYKSFVVLAQETAKASGGFLRIGSVSAVEYQWVELPMLTPILEKDDKLPSEEDSEEA